VRVALHYNIQDRKVYDETEVRARFGGLTPRQQPDIKALKGDPSDNIPGVPGVGDKTAVKLIAEFGSIEGVYDHLDQVKPPKVRESLISSRDRAFQGKSLTTISRDAPVDLNLEACRFGTYDRREVVALFRELEFFRILPRVPDPSNGAGHEVETPAVVVAQSMKQVSADLDYRLVTTRESLDEMLRELSTAGGFSFDTETTSQDPMLAGLVGMSFSTSPGRAWYLPVGHVEGTQLPLEEALAALRPLLESPDIGKTTHNGNYDATVMGSYGIVTGGLDFDTMIAAHMLGRKALGLKNLALDVLNIEMEQIKDLIGSGSRQITMDRVAIDKVKSYACADADVSGRLRRIFEEQIRREGSWDLFSRVEMPLVPILVAMERTGIALEPGALHEMSLDLDQQLGQLEADIYNLVGHVVNINSPQQLSALLFDELQISKTKRTRTGSYTTDANALEALRGAHPVIDKVLEYRQIAKLKSTYVDALPQIVNPRTGRLHTSYNQTGSATGRVSSSDPNLQNIPIRTQLGRQVRRAFVAENAPDWLLFSADYSQIELRVLAHLSRDSGLVDAFLRGEDIHSATASQMYDVPTAQVTPDMRRIAKVLNFGVVYGLSAYGISQQTEFTPEEGRSFIKTYFARYPGIQGYIESAKAQARDMGYVATVLGRRRYMPEITASNHNVRQAAERAAINMPIQGGAADIMKLAMIRVNRSMKESALRARMLLQVHDELVFEVPATEVDALREVVYREMPRALELCVPLKVDVKTGYNWGDLE
jgi:DNA polymerase-1